MQIETWGWVVRTAAALFTIIAGSALALTAAIVVSRAAWRRKQAAQYRVNIDLMHAEIKRMHDDMVERRRKRPQLVTTGKDANGDRS